MISIPKRRRRLLFCGATARQGHERLEQGALTLGALAVVTAIWLGIGLPSLPSVFSHHGGYQNERPLVAYTDDPAQPRPHAAPSSAVGKTEAVRRHGRKPAPHLVGGTSASGQRTPSATSAPKVAPSGAVQPRLEAAAPKRAAAPARDVAPEPAAPQTATPPETAAAPQPTTTTHATTTQTSTTETQGPPPPPVTVPSLPDLPDVLPNVLPLPPVPPPPTVTLPQTPPLPAVEPPSQLPPVPTQTLPTLP